MSEAVSRRLVDREKLCEDCDSWTEVWDDPEGVWESCGCGGGYITLR